jgi:hypothetical protein
LIIGSLLTQRARDVAERCGGQQVARRVGLALARRFPDIVPRAIRVNEGRFSILLDHEDAVALRNRLAGQSVEAAVTELVEAVPTP